MAKESELSNNEAKGADVERGQWGNQIEFVLTCVGYAVGLGNVWRFPYLCYQNGGGAFLIPYFLMMFLVGIPVVYLELSLGQFSSRGPTKLWTLSPLFRGIGFMMLSTAVIISLYYTIILAWSLYYLFASFTDTLPWSFCGEGWSDNACIVGSELKVLLQNETLLNKTLIERNLTSASQFKAPSEQFFYTNVLQMSGGLEEAGPVVWQLALCLLLAWIIIFLVLIKGISSLGKAIYFVSLFPYVMMTVLLVRSSMLDGANNGIMNYYLSVDFEKLKDPKVWSDAATQIFFSLSACTGGLSAMSSFNIFRNDVERDSIIVPIINCLTSFYGAFVTFGILGFMADQKGVSVDEVADQGPGLVFVVYPEALTQMPVSPLWSILFFIMLLMLGFSSILSSVESVFTIIADEFPSLRKNFRTNIIFRSCSCAFFYLVSLPMVTEGGFYLFNLLDTAISGYPLLITGLLETVIICYVYGVKRYGEDVAMMLGRKPFIMFLIDWASISPIILLVITITKAIDQTSITMGAYVYPDWGNALHWLIIAFTMIWVPIFMVYKLLKDGLIIQAFRQAARPSPEWGPASPQDRTGRYARVTIPQISLGSDAAITLSPSTTAMQNYYDNKIFRIEMTNGVS